MRGNSHVRFLGGKAVVIPLTYPTTVYAEKNQGIGIRLNITPSDKSVQYGIITSDNKKRFVYGTGSCYHVFSISDSGNYEIFIKNTSSKTVTIEGGYSVY